MMVLSLESGGVLFTAIRHEPGEEVPFPAATQRSTVSFFDRRYVDGFTRYGQLIGQYWLKTLLKLPPGSGLNLDGGVPEWSLDGAAMARVRETFGQEG